MIDMYPFMKDTKLLEVYKPASRRFLTRKRIYFILSIISSLIVLSLIIAISIYMNSGKETNEEMNNKNNKVNENQLKTNNFKNHESNDITEEKTDAHKQNDKSTKGFKDPKQVKINDKDDREGESKINKPSNDSDNEYRELFSKLSQKNYARGDLKVDDGDLKILFNDKQFSDDILKNIFNILSRFYIGQNYSEEFKNGRMSKNTFDKVFSFLDIDNKQILHSTNQDLINFKEQQNLHQNKSIENFNDLEIHDFATSMIQSLSSSDNDDSNKYNFLKLNDTLVGFRFTNKTFKTIYNKIVVKYYSTTNVFVNRYLEIYVVAKNIEQSTFIDNYACYFYKMVHESIAGKIIYN